MIATKESTELTSAPCQNYSNAVVLRNTLEHLSLMAKKESIMAKRESKMGRLHSKFHFLWLDVWDTCPSFDASRANICMMRNDEIV